LRAQLQRRIDTLLKWYPREDDLIGTRSLIDATRELGPISNRLNTSIVATRRFFSLANLSLVMKLEIARQQGITAIELEGNDTVKITRKPHWARAA
jgi:hypothetical protein